MICFYISYYILGGWLGIIMYVAIIIMLFIENNINNL